MNQEWQQFLHSQGAQFAEDQLLGFGKPLQEERDACEHLVITPLCQYGLLDVSGADATEFLQGQLTNDIKALSPHASQLSAYCTPKGRILASFRIFQQGEHYFLRLNQHLLEGTLKRMRMYVLRSKVVISDVTDSLIGIGIAGNAAGAALQGAQLAVPDAVDSVIHSGDITVIRIPGTLPRYELYAPLATMLKLWSQLEGDAVKIGYPTWQLLTIRAGIPEISSGTVEAFVPQMVNLQAINGLSFTKGCYPGQEVVARMQYLGKLKRRLYLGTVTTDSLPNPGDALMDAESGNEQSCGKVVSAAWESEQQAAVLAVIQIESASKGHLHLGAVSGPSVTLGELPYSLEKN